MTESTDFLPVVQQFSGCHELWAVHTFRGFRQRDSGGDSYELTIELRDAGPSRHDRYVVNAFTETNRTFGAPAPTVQEAVAIVRWNSLDAGSRLT